MQKEKTDIVRTLSMADKLYGILAREDMDGGGFKNTLPLVAKFCVTLFPIFQDDPVFMPLFKSVLMLSENTGTENLDAGNIKCGGIYDPERKELLRLLENFEISLMENVCFRVCIENREVSNIPVHPQYAEAVEHLQCAVSEKCDEQYLTVFVSAGEEDKAVHADFRFRTEEIVYAFNEIVARLRKPDYFRYDRLYLEAKLESLKKRQDIRLLLAGSSYTMCGLIEKQMPVPSRNVAVDAQDLYYTIKTVRKALDYNPNITDCIISLPYYFWGYDISRSTSVKMQRRVTEVNYPVFVDRHHFAGPVGEPGAPFLTSMVPLKKRIFAFEKFSQDVLDSIKKGLEDADYFQNPREGSLICSSDAEKNKKLAQMRTASHNKFFKYSATVEENKQLFANFLDEMKRHGVRMLFFVPPAAKYYRDYLDRDLKSNFYKCLNPFLENYDFKIIDLLDSEYFLDEDFFDYDHVNYQGAKKLGEKLIKELAIL